jgi:hypothetical protein
VQIQRFDSGSQLQNNRPAGIQRNDAGSTKAESAQGSRIDNSRGAGELRELSSQVAAIPEVRADVVEASRMKLQRGDYLTRVAAEKTADAFLTQGT